MMQIIEDFLTINDYSRSGKKLVSVSTIVIHWTANPNSTAKQDRYYYENRKSGTNGYGSAHYIIQDDSIIQCIPINERAFHCGTSNIDPQSGLIYTDYARERFGIYAIDHINKSPNSLTIGIELHPEDWEGNFSNSTLNSAIELTSSLLTTFNLTINDICTHNMIVGWKNCPKLFVDHPQEFEEFKNKIITFREGNNENIKV
jgi:N-acetylmuramoyl-L-alanine amidase